jgi:TP53 regulating kinase and related kinases
MLVSFDTKGIIVLFFIILMNKKFVSQGAEAKVYFVGDKGILKSRVPKSYRHEILDVQLRLRRTRSESKVLSRARSLGINVPVVVSSGRFDLLIEFIDGDKLSEKINFYQKKKQHLAIRLLGEQVAKLHDNNIIHGDLTTSNVIFSNNKIYLIDFGLSFFSTRIEDKAVDLHLIKQALEAKHYMNYLELFENFIAGYRAKDREKIIGRLDRVEKRGRYKH